MVVGFEDLVLRLMIIGFEEKWHTKYAKYSREGHQTLLAHSLSTLDAALRLADIVGLDDEKKKLVLVSSFLHDALKADYDWQKAIKKRFEVPEKFWQHDPSRLDPIIRRIASKIGLSSDFVRRVLDIIYNIEDIESVESFERVLSSRPDEIVVDIVELADKISSLKDPREILSLVSRERIKSIVSKYGLHFEFHMVNVVRGIITQLLHSSVEEAFNERGFEAVVYFANGTIYVGKNVASIDDSFKDEIKSRIVEKLKSFFRANLDRLGREAYGSIDQTVIRIPEFLFYDKKTISSFWKQFASIEDDLFAAKLIIIFNGILKVINNLDPEAKESAENVAWNEFSKIGLPQNMRETIFKLAHGSKKDIKKSVNDAFKKIENLISGGSEAFRRKLVSLFENITEKIRENLIGTRPELISLDLDRKIEDIATQLMGDLSHPVSIDRVSLIEDPVSEYFKGKREGPPLCVICGLPARHEAVASLIGDGAEGFINALEGGGRLGGKFKAWVCDLCEFERKIRAIFTQSKGKFKRRSKILQEFIYIVPQISIGYHEAGLLRDLLEKSFSGWQSGGGILGSYLIWAEKVLSSDGNWIISVVSKLPSSIVGSMKKIRQSIIRHINKLLKDEKEYKDVIVRSYPQCVDGESIWKQYLVDKLEKIREDLFGELFLESIEDKLDALGAEKEIIADYAPNFIIIGSPRFEMYNESETSSMIRKIFIGTFLAMVFQVSVILATNVDVLREFQLVSKGYCNFVPKLLIRKLFDRYGIGFTEIRGNKIFGWVGFDNADRTLRVLASVLKTEEFLRSYKTDYGSNTLVEIMKRPTGMVLNRFVSSGWKKRAILERLLYFLDLLDLYSSFLSLKGESL